jgi:hypothetical protein
MTDLQIAFVVFMVVQSVWFGTWLLFFRKQLPLASDGQINVTGGLSFVMFVVMGIVLQNGWLFAVALFLGVGGIATERWGRRLRGR